MDQQQLQQELERAANTLLTDDEICVALGITEQELKQNYATVERARIKLKQRLNAKRINDVATTGDPTDLVSAIPKSKISSRGGARPGAGRPKGTTNKISGAEILASIQLQTGEDFGTLLAQGYAEAIENNDRNTRLQYEKMFLSKVVADKVEIDLNENQTILEMKNQAFADAIKTLTQKAGTEAKD